MMNSYRLLSRRAISLVQRGQSRSSSFTSPITPALGDGIVSRRYFSSATRHEHDKFRQDGWDDSVVVVDYWTTHKNDRVIVNEAIDVIDYWKDHTDSHFCRVPESSTTSSSGPDTVHRTYSTSSDVTANKNVRTPVERKGGPVLDYWNRHNDSHYTDYWEDHPESHLKS